MCPPRLRRRGCRSLLPRHVVPQGRFGGCLCQVQPPITLIETFILHRMQSYYHPVLVVKTRTLDSSVFILPTNIKEYSIERQSVHKHRMGTLNNRQEQVPAILHGPLDRCTQTHQACTNQFITLIVSFRSQLYVFACSMCFVSAFVLMLHSALLFCPWAHCLLVLGARYNRN